MSQILHFLGGRFFLFVFSISKLQLFSHLTKKETLTHTNEKKKRKGEANNIQVPVPGTVQQKKKALSLCVKKHTSIPLQKRHPKQRASFMQMHE